MHREKTGGSWERMEPAAVLAHPIHRAQKNSRCSVTNWQRNPAHSSSNGQPMSELERQFYKWSIGLWLDSYWLLSTLLSINAFIFTKEEKMALLWTVGRFLQPPNDVRALEWCNSLSSETHMLHRITTVPSHISYITFKNHLNST